MRANTHYDEPFFWWGPTWDAPVVRGIDSLLRDGTIDPWLAAILWAALTRRRSLAVVAGASRVGKTTLLSALLDFLPPETRRVYLRGCFETFAFLDDPEVVPTETALLVNEISPHLPVYLWGPAVRRLLATAKNGFTILATAHAETAQDIVGSLAGSPLRIPMTLVTALEFVVVLEPTTETGSGGRVRGIWRLRQTRDGARIDAMPLGLPSDISQQQSTDRNTNSSLPFPSQELIQRSLILTDLRDGRIERLPDVPGSSQEVSGRDDS